MTWTSLRLVEINLINSTKETMISFIPAVLRLARSYWYVIAIGVCISYFCYRLQIERKAYRRLLEENKSSYQSQIDEINRIHSIERAEHAQNIKELQASLDASKTRYEEELKKLSQDSHAKVETLTRKYGKDPVGLATEFARATGVKIAAEGVRK